MTSAIFFYDMMCLSERRSINTSIDCTRRDYRRDGTSCYVWTHPRDLLSKVSSGRAYLIALVSYGNNSYGDALYELYTYANERL